jgi:hypothetical protein
MKSLVEWKARGQLLEYALHEKVQIQVAFSGLQPTPVRINHGG